MVVQAVLVDSCQDMVVVPGTVLPSTAPPQTISTRSSARPRAARCCCRPAGRTIDVQRRKQRRSDVHASDLAAIERGAVLRLDGAGVKRCNGYYKQGRTSISGKADYTRWLPGTGDDPGTVLFWLEGIGWSVSTSEGTTQYECPVDCTEPPENGWQSCGRRREPAPRLTWLSEAIEAYLEVQHAAAAAALRHGTADTDTLGV